LKLITIYRLPHARGGVSRAAHSNDRAGKSWGPTTWRNFPRDGAAKAAMTKWLCFNISRNAWTDYDEYAIPRRLAPHFEKLWRSDFSGDAVASDALFSDQKIGKLVLGLKEVTEKYSCDHPYIKALERGGIAHHLHRYHKPDEATRFPLILHGPPQCYGSTPSLRGSDLSRTHSFIEPS
jgi:hypothetical protein